MTTLLDLQYMTKHYKNLPFFPPKPQLPGPLCSRSYQQNPYLLKLLLVSLIVLADQSHTLLNASQGGRGRKKHAIISQTACDRTQHPCPRLGLKLIKRLIINKKFVDSSSFTLSEEKEQSLFAANLANPTVVVFHKQIQVYLCITMASIICL